MNKIINQFILLLVFFSSVSVAADTSFNATKTADNEITATWNIADKQYILTDNIAFNTKPKQPFNIQCPQGQPFEHSFFGKINIAKQQFSCVLIFDDNVANNTLVGSKVQNCTEPDICQAPISRSVKVANVALPNNNAANNIFGNLFSKIPSLGNVGDDILTVDQAFKIALPIVSNIDGGILINIAISDNHYLYKDKLKFTITGDKSVQLYKPGLPKGKVKDDPNFGKMTVIYHKIDTYVPISNGSSQPQTIDFTIYYQGCADKGICYPPAKKTFSLSIPANFQATIIKTTGIENNQNNEATFNLNNQDNDIVNSLQSGNLWLIIVAFFVAGLLLAFTPCVFPMIPILSGLIVGQKNITARKSLVLSLVYVLSMAFVYALLGVLSGLIGESIQAWFQKPWVLLSFGGIIAFMALAMFGLFELQMPSFVQNKANDISSKQKSGTLIGVSAMGMLSALIVGACSTPVLAVAIGYIGKTGDPVLGAIALFVMSLGMGLPLLIIGTSAGKWLPKNGMWMDTVKHSFGVLMLAVALYLIEPALPTVAMFALWTILLISTSVYMGAFSVAETAIQKLSKSLGLVLFVYGMIMLVGLSSGKGTLLEPLKGFGGGTVATEHKVLKFKRIKGLGDLDAELQDSVQNNQFVMMDFYADWCKSCIELEEFTFSDSGVQSALKNIKLLQADVTLNDDEDKELLKKFGINGPPAILFFDKNGIERRSFRLNGFFEPSDFIQHINSVFKR